MRWMQILILVSVCAMTGCASRPGSFCLISEAIYLHEEDLACMTDSTARAILRHNETMRTLCGI